MRLIQTVVQNLTANGAWIAVVSFENMQKSCILYHLIKNIINTILHCRLLKITDENENALESNSTEWYMVGSEIFYLKVM